MKKLITSYSFDASAKTVTFTGLASIDLERVLVITNTTDNIIIYNFADPSRGGTAATNVLTLDHDTTAMDDTDDLQIFYEVDTLDSNNYLNVNQATKLAGEDLTNDVMKTEHQFTNVFTSLASGNTLAKSGSGLWHNITFGHASTPTLIVYNNTTNSGEILQTFDAGYPRGTYVINTTFSTGLTLNFSAGVTPQVSVRIR